jgi:putative proteasome-type protease
MTYCVAMRLNSGLVFLSDSRTNAGVDHISTFRKLHTFCKEGERVLVIQSAGNLATTQSVIFQLQQQCAHSDSRNLMNVANLYEAAQLIGDTLRDTVQRHSSVQHTGSTTDFGSNFLVGGQIIGGTPSLFYVYPQGNFIEASTETPYFQIGESKYGKPIIDRVITMDTPLDRALQCALISMDSTLRSNLSVGLPLDAMIYENDSFHCHQQYRITENTPHFATIRKMWGECLYNSFMQLPPLNMNE